MAYADIYSAEVNMINYLSGDILLSKADAIAHGISPDDNFKQGLALNLREQWPSLYKDFRHYCKTTHPEEGDLWSWKGVGGPAVINLMTQGRPKSADSNPEKATIKNVNLCLKELVKEVKQKKFKSLAITKLSTGVGGLDWKEVKPLIESHLSNLDIPIYVYEKFEKGKEGKEV